MSKPFSFGNTPLQGFRGRGAEKKRLRKRKTSAEKFTVGIPNTPMKIAIEACGIWRGAYNIFRELGYEIKLANPNSKQREEQWQGKC